MEGIAVPLKQLDPELPIPAYAYPGDAGVDLRSTIDLVLHSYPAALPCLFREGTLVLSCPEADLL